MKPVTPSDTRHADAAAGARAGSGRGGAVAGYVRVSRLRGPRGGTAEAASRHRDAVAAARRAGLAADAAARGEEIEAWYADLNVSGRASALGRRADFLRLCADARAGRLRRVYARDLARLFRDVCAQERWLEEMAACGVEVVAADLPTAGEPAARRFARQQIGALHEYMAHRTSALISGALRRKVGAGEWVGTGQSRWGLRYAPAQKRFDFDPETADKIRLVFEVFIACAGLPTAAARALNRMLDERHPRATLTPRGLRWAKHHLEIVRHPHYRRAVCYDGEWMPMPERIPEVVPPEDVAEADRLLARGMAERYRARDWRHALTPPGLSGEGVPDGNNPHPTEGCEAVSTYAGFLRCGHCGRRLQAHYLPSVRHRATGATLEARAVSWFCGAGARDERDDRRRCLKATGVAAARLDALVGRGVREALLRWGWMRGLLPGDVAADDLSCPSHDRVWGAAQAVPEDRVVRLAALAAVGLLGSGGAAGASTTGQATVPPGEWDARFGSPLRPGALVDVAQWRHFMNVATALWPDAAEARPAAQAALWDHPALQKDKRGFLRDLGVAPIVWLLPRPVGERPLTRGLRHLGGQASLLLDCPRLGMGGTQSHPVKEAEEAMRAFRSWQHRRGRPEGQTRHEEREHPHPP